LQVDQKAQFWAFILSHTQVSNGRLNDPPHPMAHHGTFKNWWKRKLRTLPAVTWRIKPAKSSKFSIPYVCVGQWGVSSTTGFWIPYLQANSYCCDGDFPFYFFNIRFYLLLVLNSQWPSQLVLVIWKAFRRKLIHNIIFPPSRSTKGEGFHMSYLQSPAGCMLLLVA